MSLRAEHEALSSRSIREHCWNARAQYCGDRRGSAVARGVTRTGPCSTPRYPSASVTYTHCEELGEVLRPSFLDGSHLSERETRLWAVVVRVHRRRPGGTGSLKPSTLGSHFGSRPVGIEPAAPGPTRSDLLTKCVIATGRVGAPRVNAAVPSSRDWPNSPQSGLWPSRQQPS